jgi:hypothetical protein
MAMFYSPLAVLGKAATPNAFLSRQLNVLTTQTMGIVLQKTQRPGHEQHFPSGTPFHPDYMRRYLPGRSPVNIRLGISN